MSIDFVNATGWIRTYSGKKLDIFNPQQEDIDITDIANSLSRLCRFNGHLLPSLYSVAQHSVLVSYIIDYRYALEGLMHDVPEYGTGDCITPIKRLLPDFYTIEAILETAVRKRFKLKNSNRCNKAIKKADQIALITEARDLLKDKDSLWQKFPGLQPWPEKIKPWPQKRAYNEFLNRFYELCSL